MLHRWQLLSRQKRGSGIGKTKRGKGSKVMAIANANGLPIAIWAGGASTHEVKLVTTTLEARVVEEMPQRLIGDKAYDSDPLDSELDQMGVRMIAPHKGNRKREATQDGRELRRYRKRWKIERLFAWMHNYRRTVVRYERSIETFTGILKIVCALILLRYF